MSFEPDNVDSENEIENLLRAILIEQKKQTLMLSDVHDIDLSDEDVSDECD